MELESISIGDTVFCDTFIKSSGGRPIPVGKDKKQYEFYKTKTLGKFCIIGLKSHRNKDLPQIVAVLKKGITSQIKCARYVDLTWEKRG